MTKSVVAVFLTACAVLIELNGHAAEPKFEHQVVDDKVEIGYGLAVGDVDGDGKDDIVLADKSEFRWYRNPDWQAFTLAKNLTLRDNVCLAVADLDRDGKVEIAVGGQWNPGETSDAGQSGSVHYLIAPEDRTQLWKPIQLNHQPTVHRMQWVGGQLVVLPLHGVGNSKDPQPSETGVNICLNWVAPPGKREQIGMWRFDPIKTKLHKAHNFDVVNDELVIAAAEGIYRTSIGGGVATGLFIRPETSTPPTRGAGEVRAGQGFYAAIEPLHGNDLVIYIEGGDGDAAAAWQRITLTDELNEGHALAVGRVLGQEEEDREDIVVGWRKPDANGRVGVRIFFRSAESESMDQWQSYLIDDNGMACEDLKLADLDGDGRLDIVAAGRDSHNLKIYWNRMQ